MDQPPSLSKDASRSGLIRMISGVPLTLFGVMLLQAGRPYLGGALCVPGFLLICWGGTGLDPRLESALGLGIIGIGLILLVLYAEIQWFDRFAALEWIGTALILIGVALGGIRGRPR